MTDRYYELLNKPYWSEEDWNDYNDIAREDEKIPMQYELSTWGVGIDEDFEERWCI